MAQTKNGARAGWGQTLVETLEGAVTLKPSDSGKVFLCIAATVLYLMQLTLVQVGMLSLYINLEEIQL